MDRATVDTYEAAAADWTSRRTPRRLPVARAFGRRARPSGPVADLGCGPGWYAAVLPRPVVVMDAAHAMVARAGAVAGDGGGDGEGGPPLAVQADLEALPLKRGALAGAWANHSYVHLPRERVPMALADLHRVLRPGAPVMVSVFLGEHQGRDVFAGDDFPGRFFSTWTEPALLDVVEGAGFTLERRRRLRTGGSSIELDLVRARTLPDTVAPGMRLLLVGLNPSLYAADAGVGFARPNNRFWPAALAAGIVSRARDARHALVAHGVGMTDLVKRASVGAGELSAQEYRHGLARVERLAAWLAPGVVCFLGLAGWRAAGHRGATAGPQPVTVGGRPVYVMPNPSGLNAHVTVDGLAEHLRAAGRLGGP